MPSKKINKADLAKWRSILAKRRAEITENITDLVQDVNDCETTHTVPTHQADLGFDSELQDISLGIMDDEETLLWQIDRAINKIDTGNPIEYGLCEHTKKPIPKNRLSLLPWTPLSIEGSEYMEDQDLILQDMLIND